MDAKYLRVFSAGTRQERTFNVGWVRNAFYSVTHQALRSNTTQETLHHSVQNPKGLERSVHRAMLLHPTALLCIESMKFKHHMLEFEIDDSWLTEANMREFMPAQDCYVADQSCFPESKILIVRIEDVSPVIERAKFKGVFCDSEDTGDTAKERVLRILQWFHENKPVEPVKVVQLESSSFKYKLVEGVHRFHCALAMGFKSVPAVIGFEFEDSNA